MRLHVQMVATQRQKPFYNTCRSSALSYYSRELHWADFPDTWLLPRTPITPLGSRYLESRSLVTSSQTRANARHSHQPRAWLGQQSSRYHARESSNLPASDAHRSPNEDVYLR